MSHNNLKNLMIKFTSRLAKKEQRTQYKIFFVVFSVLLYFFLSTHLQSEANIVPNTSIIDFKATDPRQKNLELFNGDKETAYIESTIFEIRNPGTRKQERVRLNPTEQRNLIVSPNKTSLKSKNRRIIRFITTESNLAQDKIYRVTIIPKIKGVTTTGQRIGIKILVGYEILVIIRPQNTTYNLAISKNRRKQTMTFENKGNSNVLLNRVSQCDKDGKECKILLHKRLYAGNQVTVDLPYSTAPVQCEIFQADEIKKDICKAVPFE